MPLHIQEDHLHDDHFTFASNELKTTGLIKTLRASVDFETSSPHTIGTVPLGAIITKVIIKTTTAFDDSDATLDIGVSGSQSKYVYNGDFSILTANTYIAHMYEREIAETTILADIYTDGSTAGVSEILVEYAEP